MPKYIQRFSFSDRLNHWTIALTFFLAAFSGLAFFHPALYWLSGLLGGGAWSRILHPFVGVVMVLAFAKFFIGHWRENVMNEQDEEWRRTTQSAIFFEGVMPPSGMWNAGQKTMFWTMTGCVVAMLVTGIMFWRPWFDGFFPIVLQRIAAVVHAVAATLFVITVIGHIYVAYWTKGTIRGMTRGTVTEGWAKTFHVYWHQQMTGRK